MIRHEQQLTEGGRKVEAASDTNRVVEGQTNGNGDIKVEKVNTSGLERDRKQEYRREAGKVEYQKKPKQN